MILTKDEFGRKSKKRVLESATPYTHLIAVDLRDFSVQQVQIERDEKGYCFGEGYNLQRYNENQIIAFRDDCPKMIIIESFQRKTYQLWPCWITFQALSIKWQRMDFKEERSFHINAQIYKDYFYMFATDYQKFRTNLWCFGLSTFFLAIDINSFQ